MKVTKAHILPNTRKGATLVADRPTFRMWAARVEVVRSSIIAYGPGNHCLSSSAAIIRFREMSCLSSRTVLDPIPKSNKKCEYLVYRVWFFPNVFGIFLEVAYEPQERKSVCRRFRLEGD